jgi:uncharacterized delta-60 repeat protein
MYSDTPRPVGLKSDLHGEPDRREPSGAPILYARVDALCAYGVGAMAYPWKGFALIDGKFGIVGRTDVAGTPQALIARYNTDGTPDTSFGTNGRAANPAIVFGRAVALTPDGRIVVTGEANGDYVVARYTNAGALDTSFGTNGTMTIDFFGSFDTPAALAIQPDGRIVVAGRAQNGTQEVLGLARIVP